tara:strand:- start:10 stop:435 length:426 start_codon:yes stop_codon:yes gene_type:complete
MEQILFSESYADQYERKNHSVGVSMWHFEWCTKYRYKMFAKEEYCALMGACIRRSASRNGIKIIELNVQLEHVHCVVALDFKMSVAKAMQLLKGGSAFLFFKNHPKARMRYPRGHLWSPGKFMASVGFIQLEKAVDYVKNQ